MNFLIISKKDPLEYKGAFKYLEEEGFCVHFTDSLNSIPYVLFNLYIIDEEMVFLLKEIEDMPFFISITKMYNNEVYDFKNFIGFIDLSAHPLSILSFIHSSKHFIGLKEDITNLKLTQKNMENTLRSMENIVDQKTISLNNAQALTLESLATLSEYRDNETGAHIKRTKLYVKFMLEQLLGRYKFTDDEVFQIWSSAPLHDIGKVAIPDRILLKKGKLTPEEFEIMKEHVIHGNEALVRVSEGKDDDSYLRFAKEITLLHHEKWDGSGYPYGLGGTDIPISARLMALADVYDALRSVRPYKDAIDHKKVVKMIQEQSGKHFDPELVDIFINNNSEFDKLYEESIKNTFDFLKL